MKLFKLKIILNENTMCHKNSKGKHCMDYLNIPMIQFMQ